MLMRIKFVRFGIGNRISLCNYSILNKSKEDIFKKYLPENCNNEQDVLSFLKELENKLSLRCPEDWNNITKKQIQSFGGNKLFNKYSLFDLKCLACPEGRSIFTPPKSMKYLDNKENIHQFLDKLKQKYNLETIDDWNNITCKKIESLGGRTLLNKYSLYDLKCLGYPNGKEYFNKPNQVKPAKFWENKENILQFLDKLKKELNLNTPNDWNNITKKQIQLFGGGSILNKYSLLDLKLLACPDGKSIFNPSPKPSGYWDNEENVLQFLSELKLKLNLKTPEDWNLINKKQIQTFGGIRLLCKYSIYQLKCLGCPEGKSIFNPSPKPSGYWENEENVLQFLSELKLKLNLKDWNSLTKKQIQIHGGGALLYKYSLFDLKCLACPEYKSSFSPPPKPAKYWENMDNVLQFLDNLKEKYNINSLEDWNNLITRKTIKLNGGCGLLNKYSIFELKCFVYPDGKFLSSKPSGYWDNGENLLQFFKEIKQKMNLNTMEDWNLITKKDIQFYGGNSLLNKYSMYEIKCIGCPDGKYFFDRPPKPSGYWNNENNILQYLEELKYKMNLKTPEDYSRLSKVQIKQHGGVGLAYRFPIKKIIELLHPNVSVQVDKRSSQRWLFLQVKKLFPDEEIVEDYFHTEISRQSGFPVQFDIFLIQKNIAIEYHGKHHYEDNSRSGFSAIEIYKIRDEEKEKLCRNFGIRLIIIPYWWDNRLDSLQVTLNSEIKK